MKSEEQVKEKLKGARDIGRRQFYKNYELGFIDALEWVLHET